MKILKGLKQKIRLKLRWLQSKKPVLQIVRIFNLNYTLFTDKIVWSSQELLLQNKMMLKIIIKILKNLSIKINEFFFFE